jgi:hypothetical protein
MSMPLGRPFSIRGGGPCLCSPRRPAAGRLIPGLIDANKMVRIHADEKSLGMLKIENGKGRVDY